MYHFKVDLYAPTASFRVPESHTFQQSLPLPPVTAMVGMAGAALGLDFASAMKLREEEMLFCGVWGRHSGEMSDLWKYRKIKAGEVISAVLTREILADFEFKILFAMPEKNKLTELRQGFLSPVYALSAGTSDDLIKVRKVGPVQMSNPEPVHNVENTVLPGDHSQNYESSICPEDIPLNKKVRVPQVFLLPTSFKFCGNQRRVRARKAFTFIDTPVILKNPVTGIRTDWCVMPLL